jgi:hypothetical protein
LHCAAPFFPGRSSTHRSGPCAITPLGIVERCRLQLYCTQTKVLPLETKTGGCIQNRSACATSAGCAACRTMGTGRTPAISLQQYFTTTRSDIQITLRCQRTLLHSTTTTTHQQSTMRLAASQAHTNASTSTSAGTTSRQSHMSQMLHHGFSPMRSLSTSADIKAPIGLP